jgi:hypothetical protein
MFFQLGTAVLEVEGTIGVIVATLQQIYPNMAMLSIVCYGLSTASCLDVSTLCCSPIRLLIEMQHAFLIQLAEPQTYELN